MRKGDGHFLGACAQTATQPAVPSGRAAPPGWLCRSSALAAGMTPLCHTPVSLRPSRCLPGSRDHALRFSLAPRGKLAVHYIRNANAGALGRLVPGGHAAAVASLLLGESVRPSPRLGEQGGREGMLGGRGSRELFWGNTGPSRRPCGPPRRLARSLRPAGCLQAPACLGRREPPERGLRGEGCRVCAVVCVCRLPCSGSSRAGGS